MIQSMKNTPFKLDLNKAESKLKTASTLYNDNLLRLSKNLISEDLLKSYNILESIQAIEVDVDNIRSMIKCDQTSLNYRGAVNNLCTDSILGLAIIVLSSILFGLIMPVLICIIPQMWRRMHTKDLYDYHTSNGHNLTDETHPFISLNAGSGHVRTNISAARQFNESPSFQRLAVASSSVNSNTTTTNSLSRNRYNTANRSNYATSNINSNTGILPGNNNYSQTLKMNSRINEYTINTDPYLMLNNANNVNSNTLGFPSAPNQSHLNSNANGNFNLNNMNNNNNYAIMQNNNHFENKYNNNANTNALNSNAIK